MSIVYIALIILLAMLAKEKTIELEHKKGQDPKWDILAQALLALANDVDAAVGLGFGVT